MAADLNLEWICSLPRYWTYGITRGGRVFFINEEAKSTTWLHPVTGEAVVTGHLEDAEPQNADIGRKLKRSEMLYTPEPNGMASEEVTEKERQKEQVHADGSCSPQEETAMTEHQMEGPPEEAESLHEEEETLASCEPAPEIPRENQTTAALASVESSQS